MFAVAKPLYPDGGVVAVEDDPSARISLHLRVDELEDDRLGICADLARLTGGEPGDDESESEWATQLLHAGVETILVGGNRLVENLQLDGVDLFCSGEFDDEMAEVNWTFDDVYASLAALTAVGSPTSR